MSGGTHKSTEGPHVRGDDGDGNQQGGDAREETENDGGAI